MIRSQLSDGVARSAHGDLVVATLVLVALASLSRRPAIALALAFNIWVQPIYLVQPIS